jgi:hypothetical protein
VSPIGIISNPRSHRNRRGLAEVRRAAAALPEGRHRLLEEMGDLPAILADFAAAGVRLLVINGGDGTVQAVFTEIFNDGPFATPPAFAVLSGGMTNMIADDVGLGGRPERALAHLARALREDRCDVLTRRLIRCEATPGARPLHGMFFGAAAICRAILACRASVHPLRIEAEAAAGVTLAGLLLRRLLCGGQNDPVFRGERITVQVDNEEAAEGSYLLLLATTLDRLVLGSRPFWGEGAGGLRFTSIAHLSFQGAGQPGLIPMDDGERAGVAAGLLGVPVLDANPHLALAPCWHCAIDMFEEGRKPAEAACWPEPTADDLVVIACNCG